MGAVDKEGLDGPLKDLNLSTDEIDKFSKAFKDPEFLKLFEDYAKEVSDPKVKAETDAYLRQLETEGRVQEVYGKGAQLVLPTPSHVIKTADSASGTKVFINVCTSDKVDRATLKTEQKPDGSSGRAFLCPLCLGPKKEGADKAGGKCLVWDFVVHPDTLEMAARMPAVRSAVVENAVENIEANFPDVHLQREWKYPKMTYKGTEACPKPHALALRGEGSTKVGDKLKPNAGAASITPAASESAGGAAANAPAAAGVGTRSSFSFGKKQPAKAAAAKGTAAAAAPPLPPSDPATPGYVHAGGEVTPVWEVVHRGELDLAHTWGDAGRTLSPLAPCMPKELVLRVGLPGVASAGGVVLDVSALDVSLRVDGRFRLSAPLPYAVDSDRGRAKFDKARCALEVTLPVVPPPTPPPTAAAAPAAGPEEEEAGPCGVASRLVEELPLPGRPTHNEQPESVAAADGQAAEPSGCCAPVDAAEAEAAAAGRAAAAAHAAAEAAAAVPTDNERKWRELHASMASTSAALPSAAPAAADNASGAPAEAAPVSVVMQPAAVQLQPRLQACTQLADDLD